MKRHRRFYPLIIIPMLCSVATAQEFRIETHVYRQGHAEPISENLTLFSDNMIYDFMLRPDKTRFPQEIVIYLSDEKRFILLDTNRRIRTEIIESELLKILATLQSSGIAGKENKFLFQPQFDEDYDISSGWLTMTSEQLTYRAQGKRPPNDNVLHKYFEFIDQFARLNATDPRRMPPFARLKLNLSIRKIGFVPSRVEMTLVPKKDADPIQIRSEHFVMWELSEKDQKRIESAKRYWTDFARVSLAQFRGFETKDEPDQ